MADTQRIGMEQALSLSGIPILDVRSPKEFGEGHIPGAFSLPLFNDAERAAVGTAYTQVSRDEAVKIGLDCVGPKLRSMVEGAQQIAPDGKVMIHCWRGGMRSAAMAWLLSFSGMDTLVIEGGYKSYRRLVLAELALHRPMLILSGYTGSGKTELLHQLARAGEAIVDLEGLAKHKGSAFGNIAQEPQPSTEQFQNDLHQCVRGLPADSVLWLEDESMMIGTVAIPDAFYHRMQEAPHLWIDRPLEQRVQQLVSDYGQIDPAILIERFQRIGKRLGGAAVQDAINHIEEGNLAGAAEIALRYYDKAYRYTFENKGNRPAFTLETEHLDLEESTQQLIQWKSQASS